MEEVEGWMGGEYDYLNLKGQTGPLPYPAGFLYVYRGLRAATLAGEDDAVQAMGALEMPKEVVARQIERGQWLFLAIYIALLAAVLAAYYKARACPPWVAALLCASRRIHSIFMLRLFNDGVAMLPLYIAVYLFAKRRWNWGCVWFSLAVSIKMNVLLFAPPLLLLLLRNRGLSRTIQSLSICAAIQLVLGAPFLMTFPASYIGRSFNLGRAFFHKWSVNFAFMPVEQFEANILALPLLATHLALLGVFYYRWCRLYGGVKQCMFGTSAGKCRDSGAFIVAALFTGNFIGIAFSRTLHYQFYSWYFHTLPLLLWRTRLPNILRFGVFVAVEVAFNVFPATWWSSTLLQTAHLALLVGLLQSPLLVSLAQRTLVDVARATQHDLKALMDVDEAAMVDIVEVDEGGALLVDAASRRTQYVPFATPLDGGAAPGGAGLADEVGQQLQRAAAAASKRRA